MVTSPPDEPLAYRVEIPKEMKEIPMFSFGANMSVDSLKSRGVETGEKESRRAILRNYDLVFDMEPQGLFFKEGYYANVCPSPNSEVHGVVFWITQAGLVHLDGFESPRYERRWVTVELYDGGDEIKAMMYLQQPGGRNEGKPGRRYLKTLIAGAEKADLSERWISRLRSISYVDFIKFDIDSEERIEQLNRKTFKKEQVGYVRDSQDATILISILGVVLSVPNNLTKLEEKIFTFGGDLTHTFAKFVSYDAPTEGSISAEQRGFLETVLESAVSQTKRLKIVGKLEDDFEKYWQT